MDMTYEREKDPMLNSLGVLFICLGELDGIKRKWMVLLSTA